MVMLLLMDAGGVVFTAVLHVCRPRESGPHARSEVRGDTDMVYDTIQEREVIATERNTAYGHVGVMEGGINDVEYEEVKI